MRVCSDPHISEEIEKFNSGNNIASVSRPTNKRAKCSLVYSRFGQDTFVEYVMFEYICFDLGKFCHGLKLKP